MKTHIKYLLVCSFGFITLLFSCDAFDKTDHRKLNLTNNSDRNIIFYKSTVPYPDIHNINLASRANSITVKPVMRHSVKQYSITNSWESYFSNSSQGTIIFYALDYDSVTNYAARNIPYPTDTNQILQKRFVSLDTLINSNWILTYP